MEEPIVNQVVSDSPKKPLMPALIILTIILAGVGTGYLISKRSSGGISSNKLQGGAEIVSGPKEAGIKDESTFKDSTEGRLESNSGNGGEGTHKLIRPGGPSKTAYLTSSVVDLNEFEGKCVTVWGETFASQRVAWLMDVGRIKVMDSCPEGL